ncbi:amidohydrolase family protein [Dactylosporangium sp. NPDC051485]|uniref:amidohydrolase family protein n=1 Tax=Dactylosporangium sp. NPDC051485 TaxID=3154846 RepID=UPI0034149924
MPELTERTDLTAESLPWFISVDDHVVEPRDVWTSRLPKKYKDAAPHYERRKMGKARRVGSGQYVADEDADGKITDVWVYGDVVKPILRTIAGVGLPPDLRNTEQTNFDEMRPGCYDLKARIADMDMNHVEVSLCFPQMSRFCGQEFSEGKDKDLGLLCIKAYNDWQVEEWAGQSGGRIAPLAMVPLWDAQLAADEVRRNAARGVRAVTFSESPYFLGYPSIHSGYWDPFFQACHETGTVVCMHIGSSSRMEAHFIAPEAPIAVGVSLTSNNAITSLMEYLFSGVLVKFPNLKLAYSESQVGWIPYQLERADEIWEQHRTWNGVGSTLPEAPSYYYRRQVYGCFFRDYYGMKNLEAIGEDNTTFEVDYPHTDSTWPNTAATALDMFKYLTDEQIYKVSRGNAIRMLQLDLDK